MWDLIVSVPDHCLSFYFNFERKDRAALKQGTLHTKRGCINC